MIVEDVLGRQVNSEDYKCFVTMTDIIMSGWGLAENKTAKRVYLCKSFKIASELKSRISNRRDSGMRYINIVFSLPKYPQSKYVTTYDLEAETAFRY